MDDKNILSIKDGDPTRLQALEAPSKAEILKPKLEGINRKKRRRGKFKRKLVKPFVKVPWQDKRRKDKPKRNNRYRKIVLTNKTQAPFNNNQFLMEIHKPEPENSFDILGTPARTRDSSFSIDSEDNYFYSLPEDEEEYLTKEFSSVYEDAQSERLTNMSKNELIQEYLLLEAKYDTLVKRTERSKQKLFDEDENLAEEKDTLSDKESMVTDKDMSGTSNDSSATEEPSYSDLLQRLREQEERLNELQHTNEKLRLENEHLHQRPQGSCSEDSESDSSSSSDSDSSSSLSVVDTQIEDVCEEAIENGVQVNGQNGETNDTEPPLVNGFHSPNEES